MRRTPTRLLGRPLGAALAATVMLGLLTAVPESPRTVEAAPAAATESTATVFYYTKTKNWTAHRLHYAPDGGSWTTVPGLNPNFVPTSYGVPRVWAEPPPAVELTDSSIVVHSNVGSSPSELRRARNPARTGPISRQPG